MNKKLLLLTLLLFSGSFFLYAGTSAYKIDDDAIEKLFSSSTDVSSEFVVSTFNIRHSEFPFDKAKSKIEDKETTAGVVALISWAMGIGWFVPIHRFILGTGGEDFKIFASYCFTLSGCGFILLIDGIQLLLDDSETKYTNNSKFIMW